MLLSLVFLFFFFFNDTATTEIYTLSLHDALPISITRPLDNLVAGVKALAGGDFTYSITPRGSTELVELSTSLDRKSTRLNSSHGYISYAVFCLKKKKNTHSRAAVVTIQDSTNERL